MKNIVKWILRLNRKKLLYLTDKQYLKLNYYLNFNKKLDLNNTKTFNEKLQWLKLNDRRPEYTKMVDKYEAKKYVENLIGKEFIIPTLGVYDKFEEIDFDKLPNQFVIKCTHDSGGVVICRDKSKIDIENIRKRINKCLKRNFYNIGKEWPYKNIKPRIIIEEYLEDEKKENILDYKFFCFNGIPKIMYISQDSHQKNQKISFFDMNYEQLQIRRLDYEDFEILPEKPTNFEKMKKLCELLSNGIPHIRVDFYEINNRIYFSELTFYTGSGFIPFVNERYDRILGDMLELPSKNNKETK